MPSTTSVTPASPSLRLLVTGASGFIGAAVVRAARARGHHVTRLVRTASAEVEGTVTVAADLSSAHGLAALGGALATCDTVVHCAASLAGGPDEQARDTVAATRQLVTALGQHGVARVVLVSSLAVYDYRALPAGSRLDERSPVERDLETRGPYVGAKLAQEQLVREAGAALDWRIVRPGLVFGETRGWFYHLGMALPGPVWLALSGSAELPLIHVDHCAAAIVAAAEAPAARGVIANLVDDVRPTRIAYMRALAAATSPGTRVVDVPWSLLAAGGAVARRLGLTPGMLHPARLAARCKPLTYDNAAAKAALAWPGAGA